MGPNLITYTGLGPVGPELIYRDQRTQKANLFRGSMWVKCKMMEGKRNQL